MIRLFRVFIPAGILALLISELVLIISSFLLASYFVLEVDPTVFLLYDGGLIRILLVTASILLGMHLQDLYSHIRVRSRILLLQQLCLVVGIAFLAEGLISYASRDLGLPIRLMMLGSGFTVIASFVWRNLYSLCLPRMVGAQRILFVGGNPVVEAIASHLEKHPELGLAVVGYVDDGAPPGGWRCGGKVLGPMSSLREIATELNPDRIVVGISERRECAPVADLLELRLRGIVIEEASSAYESVCMRIATLELRPSQLVSSREFVPRAKILPLQTACNVVLALMGTIVLLPVMAITALAVKLSSPGPILYRQTRVGLDGKLFRICKFRSMYADAEANTGAARASQDDPRVTRAGRILRKHGLDELPPLYNVLRGDMSIVGPRPERPEFVTVLSEQIPYYRQRHCVKPGITGWAQINHKDEDAPEDTITKLEYDLYYIKNRSMSLDIYIIFNTLKAIILSRGAQ
jgi:sugar transferase (PEP-CTERM system associated)